MSVFLVLCLGSNSLSNGVFAQISIHVHLIVLMIRSLVVQPFEPCVGDHRRLGG